MPQWLYLHEKHQDGTRQFFGVALNEQWVVKATLRTTVEITHPIESKDHNHAPDNNEVSVAKARTVIETASTNNP